MADLKTRASEEQYSGQRPDKRYWGSYFGFVRDTADPEERGRVRFFCPEVMGEEDTEETWLDWALPSFPISGGFDTGSMLVPPMPSDSRKGANGSVLTDWACWVEFRHGDPRFPIYKGGCYITDADLPNFAPRISSGHSASLDESMQAPSGAQTIRTRKIVDGKIGPGSEAQEPPPAGDPRYPHNRVTKTPSGHLFELDDTPASERIKLYHRTGTYLEIDAVGSLVTKIVGKAFSYISESDIRNVVGSTLLIYGGDFTEQFRASVETLIEGVRRTIVQGLEEYFSEHSYRHTVSGAYDLSAATMTFQSMGTLAVAAADDVTFGSGGSFEAIAVDMGLLAAKSLTITCPTGVVIRGALPAEAATSFLYDTTVVEKGLKTAAATLSTALTNPAAVLEPAPLTQKALSAFAGALAGIFAGAHTQHRVGR